MDWSGCELVEIVPGKVSGAPVIAHSRVRPDDLIANLQEGPEWLAANYALPLDTVHAILLFHASAVGRATHPV